MSAQEFIRLRSGSEPTDYRRAASEEAPIEVWYEILANFPEMTQWVIQNKTVPLEVLQNLLAHDDPEIRWWLAQKRKLSYDMFLTLSQDMSASVRDRIVFNPKTPLDILESLTRDSNVEVAENARDRLDQRQN